MGIRILTIIDQGAWVAVRLMGLFQALIGELVSIFYQPNPCKDYKGFEMLYSLIFSGWMLFHSPTPEDLPAVIREKALNIGRFILVLFIVLTIINVGEAII